MKVLTEGGPNKASEVLLHTIYAEAFNFFRNGYAAALVVVFLLFIMALSAVRLFVLGRQPDMSGVRLSPSRARAAPSRADDRHRGDAAVRSSSC